MQTSQNSSAFTAPTGAESTEPFRSSVFTADNVELPLYCWPVIGTPRATVALIHGLAEHAGRYRALATRLNAAGVELVAIDLRGHGRAPASAHTSNDSTITCWTHRLYSMPHPRRVRMPRFF